MKDQPREWISLKCRACGGTYAWPKGDPPPRLGTCGQYYCIGHAAYDERLAEYEAMRNYQKEAKE